MAPAADYALRRKSCGLLRSASACGSLARDGIIKGATLWVGGKAEAGRMELEAGGGAAESTENAGVLYTMNKAKQTKAIMSNIAGGL